MNCSRREFVRSIAGVVPSAFLGAQTPSKRPNVILIITDDQGYGDLSIHGNPHLNTPNIDSVGKQGVQFTQFQVCPVCSPTRSSVMTGRYNYRTGVVDTFLGRSMMFPDEVTIAEILRDGGYRTGIFGKWHLGDVYPMRAMDKGFQESLVHRGGGIGQPADPPGNSYFNPTLYRNGSPVKHTGYCTDIFFDAAIQWIRSGGSKPYFIYLATNAPHGPLHIADEHVEPFRKRGVPEATAKVYGMVENIDKNMGRLLETLRALGQERDTIVIFMTDNGATGESRYAAGMRGQKAGPYQGGIRVPFFVRWPARLKSGFKVDRIAAHIDILPTLVEACGVQKPAKLSLDGRSILPLAEGKAADWADRTLITQWHRGDRPDPFRNCAVRTQRYKLVNGSELFDMESDPGETREISGSHPDVVARLRKAYEDWLHNVSTRNYQAPRMHIGSPHEDIVLLTRQDWRVAPDAKNGAPGWWEVDVKRAGKYRVLVTLDAPVADAEVTFSLNQVRVSATVAKAATEWQFVTPSLPAGPGRIDVIVKSGATTRGARYVEIRSA